MQDTVDIVKDSIRGILKQVVQQGANHGLSAEQFRIMMDEALVDFVDYETTAKGKTKW